MNLYLISKLNAERIESKDNYLINRFRDSYIIDMMNGNFF